MMASKERARQALFLQQGLDLTDYNNLQFLHSLTREELEKWAADLETWQLCYAHSLIEIDILVKLDRVNTIGIAEQLLNTIKEQSKRGSKPSFGPTSKPK
jgi:hypothetical protein